jgi:hypothetical protein
MHYTRRQTWLPLVALVAGLALLAPAPAADTDDTGFTPLFNGKDFSGWKFLLQGNADPAKTFVIKDGVIICTGKPNGYFYTDKSFKNYVLRYDWRYQRPSGLTDDSAFRGNSGLLVHIQLPHQIWPKSVEVQGQNATHGRTFAIGSKKGDPAPSTFTGKFDPTVQKGAVRPVGEWNTTEVVCQDGAITCKINGKQVDAGKGNLTEGPIGLQSEGSEIHFRNIRIKELK